MIGRSPSGARRRLPCMRIAFLTGIWPPDVGGPATHGLRALPDRARAHRQGRDDGRRRADGAALRGRGRLPAPPVPAPVRAGGAARCARGARADIVYATATYAAAAAAAVAARRPLVVKLVSDPRTSGRCGTGSSRARWKSSSARKAQPCARSRQRAPGAPPGSDGGRSQHVPRRDRAQLGSRRRARARADEPGSPADAGRA